MVHIKGTFNYNLNTTGITNNTNSITNNGTLTQNADAVFSNTIYAPAIRSSSAPFYVLEIILIQPQ